MQSTAESRRHFLASVAALGASAPLLPGVLWAKMSEAGASKIDAAMLKSAATIAGLQFSDETLASMVQGVNQNLGRIDQLHAQKIPNNVAPPFYFSPIVPGMQVDRNRAPLKMSKLPALKRPANLEEVAFWPVTHIAQLLKTRAVTSVELTEMYLGRLKRHNPKINCVVSFCDELAMRQALQADSEIAAGKYRGPLHGMPWGAKDIIAVKGYKTTWGSGAYKDQVIDEEASVYEMIRDAGGVLLAKLTTGELAGGDQWFGGRTNNPWKLDEGASGSSAGPCGRCAT